MKRSKLIVLSGEAGAGKDSLAEVLVSRYGWQLYSLAGPLKRFSEDMFGFTKEQVYGPSSARNAPDPRWARPCGHCKGTGRVRSMRMHDCSLCDGKGVINDNSPRRVLQLLGEEYLRQMIHVDALTMRARPDIEMMLWKIQHGDQLGGVVVNDARNDNDRNNLHDWLGGCRVAVRSTRVNDVKKPAWRLHASEQRQATNDQLEYVVQNDEEWPFPSLPAKVEAMLKDLYG